MSPHAQLAQHLIDDAEALAERRKSLERVTGHRASGALADVDGAMALLRRASSKLLASQSTDVLPAVRAPR